MACVHLWTLFITFWLLQLTSSWSSITKVANVVAMVTGQNILLLLICYYGKFQVLFFSLSNNMCALCCSIAWPLRFESKFSNMYTRAKIARKSANLKFWKTIVFRSTIEVYIFPYIKLIRHNFLETNVLNTEHPTLLWKFRLRDLVLSSWIWQCNRWVVTIWKVDSMSHINVTY